MSGEQTNPQPWSYTSEEARAARAALAKAVNDYMQLLRPDEKPFVLGWTVAVEWTNPELEQSGRAGRDVAAPEEQLLSTTAGLGHYIVRIYG